MSMRFRTFDELTPAMDADRLLVHLAALGGATDRRSVERWRRRSDLFAEYVGVFAVEAGRVVGQTLVKRLTYTFADRTERIGAVASVAVRPDRARGGLARRLLAEVDRREREAGIRYVALWTNRSWGAHRLYEKLGYEDTYTFPWAVRRPRPGRSARRGGAVSPARARELAALDRLHDRRARGRVGFCRRPRSFLPIAATNGELDPATELLIAREGGRIVGYAHVLSNGVRTICGELIADSEPVLEQLIEGVEARAGENAVAFQHTPVSDARSLLHRRGYSVLAAGWYVFMTHAIDGPWSARSARSTFLPDDPRFLCGSADRF
jgi:GNAT superfamily N-acetyltransferase